MQHVIEKVANHLNAAKVTWAAGASWMLKQHGIVEQVGDFDMLVALADFPRTHELLLRLGTGRAGETKHPYWTQHFYTYEIDGVEVDVMAGFTLEHEAGRYEYPFAADHVTEVVAVGSAKVPLTSPEDWYVLYFLMGRQRRIEALDTHFQRLGLAHPQLLRKALRQLLPTALDAQLARLLSLTT